MRFLSATTFLTWLAFACAADAAPAPQQVDIPAGPITLHAQLFKPDGDGPFPTVTPGVLDVLAGFTLRPYRHSTTFPDPNDLVDGVEYGLPNTRKREKTTRVEVELARGFGDYVVVGAHWRYLDNNSTAKVEYDYLGLSSRTFVVPVVAPFLVGDVLANRRRNTEW